MTIFLSSPCLCTEASSPHCAATARCFSRDMTLLQSSSPSTATGTTTTPLSRCAPSWRRGASQSLRAQPSSPVIPSSRDDLDEARSFAKRALESIGRTGRLALPGREDHDSLVFKGSSFHPCGDDRCIRCMACADICPTGAVDRADPRMSNGACIDVCPVSSRGYHDEAYRAAETTFAAKCSGRRKNEIFLL